MGWSIHPGEHLLSVYHDAWQTLNAECNEAHPLLDMKFIGPAYRHFCRNRSDTCLAVAEQGGVVGALALLERKGYGVWQLFLPSQAPIGPAIFCPNRLGTDRASWFDRLLRELPGRAWLMEFLNQDPMCSQLLEDPRIGHIEALSYGTTVNISVDGDFDVYWQGRSSMLQGKVRRLFRKLEKQGTPATLVERRDCEEMSDAVARHGDLESAGWKGRQGTAIHRDNVQGRFYTEVLCNFAQTKASAAYQLYFGDRLVASQLTISQNGMMVLLKTAHDEAVSAYSPGRLLDFLMLQKLFAEKPVDVVEFYTNASQEDARWCTGSRSISHINYFRSPILKHAVVATRKLRKRVEPDARQFFASSHGERESS